jgi:hypothetical protein
MLKGDAAMEQVLVVESGFQLVRPAIVGDGDASKMRTRPPC